MLEKKNTFLISNGLLILHVKSTCQGNRTSCNFVPGFYRQKYINKTVNYLKGSYVNTVKPSYKIEGPMKTGDYTIL